MTREELTALVYKHGWQLMGNRVVTHITVGDAFKTVSEDIDALLSFAGNPVDAFIARIEATWPEVLAVVKRGRK